VGDINQKTLVSFAQTLDESKKDDSITEFVNAIEGNAIDGFLDRTKKFWMPG
jgi:hypothetical protein